MTSHLMKAGNDIRHTLFGAFSPTQNVTTKLRGSLERVTYANLFPALLYFLMYSLLFVVYRYYQIIYMNLPMESYTSQSLMCTLVKTF